MGVRSWEANLYSREQEWRERAEKAEAENARLREAVREWVDAGELFRREGTMVRDRWDIACERLRALAGRAVTTKKGRK